MRGMGNIPNRAMLGMGGMPARAMSSGVASKRKKLRAQDVFSTNLYSSGSGNVGRIFPLPFIPKLSIQANRTNASGLVRPVLDAARPGFALQTDKTDAQISNGSFMNGATFGFPQAQSSGGNIVAWNYAEAPKFFKALVVQKVAGVALDVDLSSLGIVGEVRAKAVDTATDWFVWTRGVFLQSGTQNNMKLNTTGIAGSGGPLSVSGTTLTIAASFAAGSYIIHAFAHDDGPNSLIKCGFYIGNSSAAGPSIDLGWRPQFVEIKTFTPFTGSWYIVDNVRSGIVTGGNDAIIAEDTGAVAEDAITDYIDFTSTGFTLKSASTAVNGSGRGYVYRAIREAA